MLIKILISLLYSILVCAKPNLPKRQNEEEKKYIYIIGQRTLSYLSLYNKDGNLLGRRVLTSSLYESKIMDQIKDYLNNNEEIIKNTDVVELIGANHAGFLINDDLFEYGAYPMESLKNENSYNYESGPFHWRQNQSTSSTTEWSKQSYLWGQKNYHKDITYSESDFQKAINNNSTAFQQVKKFNWKCNYDEEKKRCTNFDSIIDKSYDLLIMGLTKITMPENLVNEYRKFKEEAKLFDPQILRKFEVQNKNFENAINWFNSTITELRQQNVTCENTENVSAIHYVLKYECDHLIDQDIINSSFLTSNGFKSLSNKGLMIFLVTVTTILLQII